jgi:DNA-nicking Smr family endonuclease
MTSPRGLSESERALWQRVASSVTPLHRKTQVATPSAIQGSDDPLPSSKSQQTDDQPKKNVKGRVPPPMSAPQVKPPVAQPDKAGLDSHWERRLRNASLAPDVTLDFHGHTLDQAHRRLDHGMAQAKTIGARLVLVVTGRQRPVEAADRADRRGAIRAKILDWLAAGPHASDIAAIRKAHRRHGGEGALYIILKRKGPQSGAPR